MVLCNTEKLTKKKTAAQRAIAEAIAEFKSNHRHLPPIPLIIGLLFSPKGAFLGYFPYM